MTQVPVTRIVSKAYKPLSALLLCFLLTLAPAHGQAIFGSINGVVTDASGAVLPGASITLTDTDKGTSRVVVSSAAGEYLVHDLIPDHYTLKVDATGFSTAQADVTVSADTSAQLNFQLKPGTASQTIEVTAEAAQLKTDRADVSTVLNTLTLEETPNLVRNTTSLVSCLAPATTSFGLFQRER